MPGIAGLHLAPTDREPLETRLAALGGALQINPSWPIKPWRKDADGVGLVAVGRDAAAAERSAASLDSDHLVMEGELFGGYLRVADGLSPAEYLLRGYRESGEAFLRGVEGRFVAAIWSADAQTLTLLADKLASKPLYYAQRPDGLAFSTSVRAIAALPGADTGLNLDGVVPFFTFGHLWNADTFFASIRCLRPASRLVYSLADGRVTTSRYWVPQAEVVAPDDREGFARLSSALKRAVDEQTNAAEGVGVALSGGLDARTLLGLVDTDRVRPKCVSLGMEGSLDQRSARRLAELAGCEYHQLTLGEGFLDGFEGHLRRMVELTDGHYLSQCIVMPTLPLYQRLGVRVLLRGHVGELLHLHKAYNFSIDSEFDSVRDSAGLEAWLWPRLQSHLTEGVDEDLLQGVSQADCREAAKRTLRAALADTEHWDRPLDRLSQLFLDQRTCRETAMSLVKFNSVVDVRVPYFDGRVLEAVFAAPAGLRTGERAQTDMLREHRPDFLAPANSNTGAPVGAGEFWKQFCYYRMRVLAKLGVRGYQPYERLGLWLRRELRPVVEKVLLDAACLDRGLFNPDCVRNVVRRHSAGQANHTYLIMAMMALELGMQNAGAQAASLATEPLALRE